jgi:NADH-quinone oxidoreductase subunit F
MDLHLLDAAPTIAERRAVEHVLGPPAGGWDGGARDSDRQGHSLRGGGHEARSRRHLLLPVLLAVQEHVGWVSPGALNHIAERLTVPPADIYGVASFYALLSVEPRPARVLHVCEDLACRCNGSQELIAQLEEHLGPEGELNLDGSGTWLRSPCLGQCDRAPAALVTLAGEHPEEHVLAPVGAAAALAAIDGHANEAADPVTELPQHGDGSLQLLARIGQVDPLSLDDYRARGGYAALRRALELGGEGVIRELKDSRLMGRGGAAFPTGVKWEAVAHQTAHPHYLICNADESEPGTFKDRVVIEGDPYSLIEAMTIAAYATGCEHGYVYLRGEYPQAHAILGAALAEARRRGYLGTDILGEGFTFDIEIRKGGGAYICGEETAIFNSIEGFRGEPRSKPPFPVVAGLFGKPTVVNNVETLVNVLGVVLASGPGYAGIGTEGSTGTKLFCLSGNVERPGVYEVPFGATLRELLELAGGVAGGRELQAILMGGAAGGFLRPDELDLPLTFEGAREAKTTLGSGVVLVLDDRVDLPRFLQRIAAFFRNESCGQCVPCRVGTVRQQEALARLASGRTRGGAGAELALVAEIGQCMRDASICGLGQTASSAIESAIGRLGAFGGTT